MMKMDELIIKKKRGEVLSGLQISWEKKPPENRPRDSCNTTSSSNRKFISTALKVSHYFTSSHIKNIYHNPLNTKNTLIPAPQKSKQTTPQGAEK
jgi:hypothetical protein